MAGKRKARKKRQKYYCRKCSLHHLKSSAIGRQHR